MDMSNTYRSRSGYFNRAFENIDQMADNMLKVIPKHVEYDTLVGTGLSGTLVVPFLARALGEYWAIVRKEHSPHSNNLIEGEIGQKWLFVDDFISSGSTLRRVKNVLNNLNRYETTHFVTKYVGTYQYEHNTYIGR